MVIQTQATNAPCHKANKSRSNGSLSTTLGMRYRRDNALIIPVMICYKMRMCPTPRSSLLTRGYDSNQIRQDVEDKGGVAVIPVRSNHKEQPFLDPSVYALRNQIERCSNKLKNARRLATRYDKTARSYLGYIQIVAARLWVNQFVNRAYGFQNTEAYMISQKSLEDVETLICCMNFRASSGSCKSMGRTKLVS